MPYNRYNHHPMFPGTGQVMSLLW